MFEHAPPVSEVDVLTSPDAVAAELAHSLPRGEDITALLLLDPDLLSDAGRVDLLVALERHLALLQAAQQQVLASLDGRALDAVSGHRRTTADDRADTQGGADLFAGVIDQLRAGPGPTGHPPTSPTTSSPATKRADSQDADAPPDYAISIMVMRGARAARPTART